MSRSRADRPGLCFVGPLAGQKFGYVVTQAVRLSAHFREAGYSVTAVSASPNRYVRLLDIVSTLIRERRRTEIVILHVYSGPSFVVEDIASWIARRNGHRIIMLLHGGALPEFMQAYPRWTSRVIRRADAIVAPSAFLAREIRKRGLTCRIIPNVIDISQYPYRHRPSVKPRLFWMRTFHPIYNPLMAIRVAAQIRKTHPDVHLAMGGQDKGMEREVKRFADDQGMRGAVTFPGFLDMAGKIREGGAADIFINTSHIDNMPVAVVEACAMGIPVVSTSVGGVPDLLTEGQSGLLTPDGDTDAMVAAIRRLCGDPGLAARLSENGRRLAERSAWERVRVEWEDLFASLVSRQADSGLQVS